MSSTTEQIKDRLSIVEVVESYLKLEKAGANMKAKCPFHNEKTASFTVSPSRGTFHCFGCHKGGDIFSFVEEIEGIDFSGALKILADRAGVALERDNPEAREEQNVLYSILEEATLFFESKLKDDIQTLQYLKDRGLTDETIKDFRLGYANDQWTELLSFLRTKGFKDVDIEKTGLIIPGGKSGYYDRFRKRILFPIGNHSGKYVGYSGRIFPEDDSKDKAKYINSPETALYHKSKVLYGYHQAKASIRSKDYCIFVEGQMDLLMSHQAGFTNTVAVSGTAMTEEHLLAIKRLTDNLVIAFDSDQAGVSASEKSFNMALLLDLNVKVVKLPKGKDPADFILENQSAWDGAIKGAKHLIDFYLDTLLEEDYDDRKLGLEVGSKILPYVINIRNNIEQDHFISKISDKTKIPKEVLQKELERIISQTTEDKSNYNNIIPPPLKQVTRRNIIEGKILSIILWQEKAGEPSIDLLKYKERLKIIIGQDRLDELDKLSQKTKDALIFKAEESHKDNDNLDYRMNDLFINLEKEILTTQIKEKTEKLKDSEKNGEEVELTKLQEEIQELHQKISNLNNLSNQ